MRWIFDNFTKLLGLLSFDLIATATLHDWGYFYVVGPQFRSIQTTYDYITQAIEWLPGLFLTAIISLGAASIILFITASRVPAGFEGQHQPFVRRRTVIIMVIGASFAALSFIRSLYVVYPLSLEPLVLAMALLLVSLCTAVSSLSADRPRWAFLLASGIAIGSFIFVHGIGDGIADVRQISKVHRVEVKGGFARQVMLLRSFEKGVLIRNPEDSQIEFIRWDQIDKISHRVSLAIEPTGCRWLAFLCPQIVMP